MAVSAILSVSCSAFPEALTLSTMTVAFEAVSESVEDEDDVDSVSATAARRGVVKESGTFTAPSAELLPAASGTL